MVAEFFAEGGGDVAIAMTPGTDGILQVFADGDKIFDRADEGGKYPDLSRIKQLRDEIRLRLTEVAVADD